jgi:hypothetical protein
MKMLTGETGSVQPIGATVIVSSLSSHLEDSGSNVPAAGARWQSVWLVLLISLVTLLNAIKPIHIDDTAFYASALQISRHPLDPYGFTIFWAQWPEPAIRELCTPVLPYWWAIAIRLFGTSPVMWKIWLLPFVALFVISLHRLFRRFARGMEMPLVLLTVLSPTFLPALNMMMDIPAMALGLAACVIAMRAIDTDSYSLASFAGLLAGLAIETKYTAALFPAVIVVYGILQRRTWLGVLPAFIAAAMFIAWEAIIFGRYGASQFVFYLNLKDSMKGFVSKDQMLVALPLLIGALTPMIGLLGLAALDVPGWALVIGAVGVVIAYAAVSYAIVAVGFYLVLGVVMSAVVARVVYTLTRRRDKDDLFVILWLALELVGFIFVSPFAASRRLMGLVVVITLVVGRLARRTKLRPRRRAMVNWIVAGGVCMGLGFYALDLTEALAQKHALEEAAAIVEAHRRPGQTVWFGGHWGFQFYAEQAGFQPIIPDNSNLKRGDLVVFPHPLIDAQRVMLPSSCVEEIQRIQIDDAVPLSTVPFYYSTSVPVQYRLRPRVTVSILRVTKDYTPLTTYAWKIIADWAINRNRPLPPASIRALLMTMDEVDPSTARKLGDAIITGAPAALNASLNDPDPDVREAAQKLLQSH